MIQSPYGDVVITYDGKMIPFECKQAFSKNFPNIENTYRLIVSIKPDGKEHYLKLEVHHGIDCSNHRDNDSGERYVGNAYRYEDGELHIGCLEAEEPIYDYDSWSESEAISIVIEPDTKTEVYHFVVVWAMYDEIDGAVNYEYQMVNAADTYVRDDYYDCIQDPPSIIWDNLHLRGQRVRVTCVDGDVLEGVWLDWFNGGKEILWTPCILVGGVEAYAPNRVEIIGYDIKSIEPID